MYAVPLCGSSTIGPGRDHSSVGSIDSDWAIRGGKEQFRDWVGLDDTW